MQKRKLSDFLQWVLNPGGPPGNPGVRKIKLLSMLLLFFASGSLLYSILQMMTESGSSLMFYWINGTSVTFIFAYLLNRRGYFRLAAILAVAVLSFSILISVILAPGANNHYLFVIIMPVLICSILLSLKDTLMIEIYTLVGVLLLILFSPVVTMDMAAAPLGFFFTMSVLILVSMSHRGKLEAERRAELLEKEEKYRSLVENINEAIFTMDADGVFTYISPVAEQFTQYKVEEMVGRHFSYFIHPDDLQALEESTMRLTNGVEESIKFRFINKDGKTIHIRTSSHLTFENGEPKEITGVVTNITEKTKLENQLHHAQKMESVGRLAGGVAHDFNNLIAVIMGYCQLLEMDMPPGSPSGELLNSIKTAVNRAAALTQQLLAFSRKQIIEPRILNLNKEVTDIMEMLHRLVGEQITLKTHLTPGVRDIKVDPAQLEQVMVNLVVNAVDAMPKGGTLSIETVDVYLDKNECRGRDEAEPGNYAILSVKDTGCGMGEETKSFLFEPFFTTKARGKGTGLGLSTVYGIVKQNGGHILVNSEVDKGTTFSTFFPAITDAEKNPTTARKPVKADGIRGNETLLVVEDETELREVIVKVLTNYGYKIYAAENGVEALKLYRRLGTETIDAVITDIVMPGMNGKGLADEISTLQPGVKILYISGYAEETLLEKGISLKEQIYFLPKPFPPQELARKIREILAHTAPAADGY
ncbi:MAG: PAS domain S-box protein [bacterium]|nr:PAS domain S-box protein [bacterium]